jgi:hypothetical protein
MPSRVSKLVACALLGACDATVGSGPDAATVAADATAHDPTDAGLAPTDAGEPAPPPPEPREIVRVATVDELLAALAAATAGTVIHIADDATLDLSGRENIAVPARVTVASGGGVGGAGGALLFTDTLDTMPLFTAGEGARFTGLRIRGPDTEIGDTPYGRPVSRGIAAVRANNVQVDHSELWGWAHAAIVVDYSRRIHVHHNSIHHNRRTGLGYGVVLIHDADALIERNSFDYNRHSIAGTGRRTISYEARYNLVGRNRNGHAFDMHGENEADHNGAPWAGDVIDIHHNTFLGTVRAILIRGRPRTGAYVSGNCFGQSRASGTAVAQTNFTGNLHVGTNLYSQSAGTCHAPASANPRALRSDVNGDGFADLVTLLRGSTYTHLGAGSGLFDPQSTSFRGTVDSALFDGEGHLAIDVADVNGDGRADLVTAHSDGNVYVHPGNLLGGFDDGVASFEGTYSLDPVEGFEPIAVADVNGDGLGDLVSHRGGSVFVHAGAADATFGSAVESFDGTYRSGPSTGTGHFAVDVADVTGDGRADFVSITDGGTAYVYPGQASFAFGRSTASFAGTAQLSFLDGEGFEPIGCGDVTGDGRADLVMSHTDENVYVYPGTATGAFGSRVESFHGTMPSSLYTRAGFEIVAPLDVTGDGRADLVAAHSNGIVYVYRGNANGSFSTRFESFEGAFRSARFGESGHEALAERSVLRRRGCDPAGCL